MNKYQKVCLGLIIIAIFWLVLAIRCIIKVQSATSNKAVNDLSSTGLIYCVLALLTAAIAEKFLRKSEKLNK